MPFKIRVGADKEETPRHGFCPRPVSATRRSIPRPPSIAPKPGSKGPSSVPGGEPPRPLQTGSPAEALRRSPVPAVPARRSEEHTSELQSLMRNSYAVFCLKKKNTHHTLEP